MFQDLGCLGLIPTEQGIAEVVVDKDVVEGRKEPVRGLKGQEEAA